MSSPLFFGVPDAAPRFLGRDALVERMAARLASSVTLTLAMVGPGGVGKTSLAAALAHDARVRARFADGVLWTALGTSPDPAGALNAWAGALGLTVTGLPSLEDRAAALREAIGYRRILLVVDDVWDEDAAWLLQCGGPLCSYLFTTRGEAIARRLAGGRGVEVVPVLDEEASLALLARWAPRACAAAPESARAAVAAVHGLPLALEVLGGYLAGSPPGDADSRLRHAAERLANPSPVPPAPTLLDDVLALFRQAAGVLFGSPGEGAAGEEGSAEPSPLETVVRLSLDDLPREVAEAFYELGPFAPKPETFDEAAAGAVAGIGEAELALLIARGLVERSGDAYTLHPAIADVARAGMPAEAAWRHVAHYVMRVREAGGDWRAVERVYGQAKWAWDRLGPQKQEQRLLLAEALGEFQRLRGLGHDAVAWGEAATQGAPPPAFEKRYVSALFNLGWAYDALGLADRALETYRRCLELHRRDGNDAGTAATLNNMGMVHAGLGEWEKALEHFERARGFRDRVNDPTGTAITLSNIAGIYEQQGRRLEALEHYRAVVPLLEAGGDRNALAITFNNMGLLYSNIDAPDLALEHYARAVPLLEADGDQANLALTLHNLGVLYHELGAPEAALERFARALSIREALGDCRQCVRTLRWMAHVYREMGDSEKEMECLRRAQPFLRELGERAAASRTERWPGDA